MFGRLGHGLSTLPDPSGPRCSRVVTDSRSVKSRDKLVPYVVPSTYPVEPSAARSIGHGLWAVLAEDAGNLAANVRAAGLGEFGIDSVDAAWPIALANLERVFRKLESHLFPPEDGKPAFLLCGGHWLAATCAIAPGVHARASQRLRTPDLLVSIPQRDALVIFPRGAAADRDEMRRQIRIAEADARKPLTWELFALTPDGLVEFHEA